MERIPTVNFHILLACNMGCSFCFATNLPKPNLAPSEAIKIVGMLPQAGFKKINFAGGEPMLYPELDSVIRAAKECGMTTSMVTNGTRVTDEWLEGMSRHLDWLALSMDSVDPRAHHRSGRATKDGPLPTNVYAEICRDVKHHGIRLKVNTVVSRHNWKETMSGFIRIAQPERWKIMRALPVEGQNDSSAGSFEVTDEQYAAYLERNRSVNGVAIVPEDNDQMLGSYVMIDPQGCFFDNTRPYAYSQYKFEIVMGSAASGHEDYTKLSAPCHFDAGSASGSRFGA